MTLVSRFFLGGGWFVIELHIALVRLPTRGPKDANFTTEAKGPVVYNHMYNLQCGTQNPLTKTEAR